MYIWYTRVYVCMGGTHFISKYTHVYACIHTHTHACRMHMTINDLDIQKCTNTHTCIHTYAHTCIHTRARTHAHTHTYTPVIIVVVIDINVEII
jgi:hypothetical protein